MVGLVSLIFFATQSTHALTANAADTLFFARFGVEFLPVMYMVLGLAAMATLLVYATGLAGLPREHFYPLVLVVSAVIVGLLRFSVLLEERWVYAATWIIGSLTLLVTFTLMWNVAGDVTDARSGKRLFPLFASAAILGAIVGNLATGPLAALIGVEDILLVVAAILVVVAVLVRRNAMRHSRVGADPPATKGTLREVREGYRRALESPLLRLLGLAMILASVLFYSVAFPFSAAVADAFTTETKIASYLGFFAAAATSVTFLVSLFVAERLFRFIGIIGALVVVALTYLVGFGVWLVTFGLLTASVVRFAQWVAVTGIGGTATTAVFNVVRADHRGSVTAFMFAVPFQLGITVAGLLLWFADRRLSTFQLFVIGFLAAAVYVAVIWAMRSRYLQALVGALRSGVTDAFLTVDQAVPSTRANAETVAAIRDALRSDKAELRRAALEVTALVAAGQLSEEVRKALGDPDLGVRVAAVEALRATDEPIGEDVVHVLNPDMGFAGTLDAAPPATKRRAAVLLDAVDQREAAEAMLIGMTRSPEPGQRVAGFIGFAQTGHTPEEARASHHVIEDRSPAVRAAAARAIAADPDQDHGPVIAAMGDSSAQVRRAGAEGWRAAGLPTEVLFDVVTTGPAPAREAALIALSPAGADAAARLRGMVRPFLESAVLDSGRASVAADLAVLPSAAAAWLAELLDQRSWAAQRVVIRALRADEDAAATELILGGLRSEDADARAQATEALDTRHDSLSRRLLALVEGEASPPQVSEVLLELARDDDEWIRALALRGMADQSSSQWGPTIAELAEDPSPIVRATAGSLLAIMGSAMSDELDVVGPVERVVALRQIPIFSSLSPEDLHRIADAAEERTFPAGALVFTAGEPGTEMYLILEGTLASTYPTERGVETFAEYGAGEQVGELSLLRGAPRASGVVATTDARVLAITNEVVETLLAERPDVARAILASVAERLAAVTAPAESPDASR